MPPNRYSTADVGQNITAIVRPTMALSINFQVCRRRSLFRQSPARAVIFSSATVVNDPPEP